MKTFLVIVSLLISAQSFAVDSGDPMFICKVNGDKTQYAVTRDKTGKMFAGFGSASEDIENLELESAKVVDLKQVGDKCTLTLEHKFKGEKKKTKIVLEDGEVFLKANSTAQSKSAHCDEVSKAGMKFLKACEAEKEKEIVEAMTCESKPDSDGLVVKMRIFANEDLSYAEREIFSESEDGEEKKNYGTKEIVMTSSEEDGKCVIAIKEAHQDDYNYLDMTVKPPKESSGKGVARVEESVMGRKSKISRLPEDYKDMKCKFKDSFFERKESCGFKTKSAKAEKEEGTASKRKPRGSDERGKNRGTN